MSAAISCNNKTIIGPPEDRDLASIAGQNWRLFDDYLVTGLDAPDHLNR
jgi:hypothetical protein